MGFEYSLRAVTTTKRVLMERVAADEGQEARPWVDIASFDSYNDAERVLKLIRKALEV